MSKKNTRIYLSYSLNLFLDLIRLSILEKRRLFKFYGIYVITNQTKYELTNNLKKVESSNYISTEIVCLASRFKKLKINKYNQTYYEIPFEEQLQLNLRYIISFIDIIRSSYKLENNNCDLYVNSTGDKIVDIILKKYLKRKFKINTNFIFFGKIIKPSKKLYFSFKALKTLSILSILKFIPIKKKYNLSKFANKKMIWIGHNINKNNKPYLYFSSDKTIKENICKIDLSEIYSYGLNRFESLLWLMKEIIINLFKFEKKDLFNFFRYSLYLDYFQVILNKLCVHNINILLKKIDVNYLICSFISFSHEKLIYHSCRISKVKSIKYDWSMGYPIEIKNYKQQIIFTLKPDIVLVESKFRADQYLKVNKVKIKLGQRMKIIICQSLLAEYAINKIKNSRNYKYLDANLKNISVFDNLYGDNAGVRNLYTDNLVQVLFQNKKNVNIFVHSKKKNFYLENRLIKKGIKNIRAKKGDFTLSNISDFIISIGFQGAAIQASFASKKPVIFFSTDPCYFDNLVFTDNQDYNIAILKIFKDLIFNHDKLFNLLNNNVNYESNLNILNSKTEKFLRFIGITENQISSINYIKKLFK